MMNDELKPAILSSRSSFIVHHSPKMPAYYLKQDQEIPADCRGGAVTIGNFDGVHRGHQQILQEVRRQGRPAVAVTFDPHPLQLLRPAQFQPLVTSVNRRVELLHGHGADHVLILAVTRTFLQLSAREFFDEVLCRRLDARVAVEGPNFGFGRNREGTVETLTALCQQAGRRLVVVPPLEWEGKAISSSRIRNELLAGAVGKARLLLGRPFSLEGTVGTGQARGKTIGFPTANLQGITTLIPGDGVYAVRVLWHDKKFYGAANIGPNPTFGENARKVEVHLIDFAGDLYGQTLSVEFIERIRNTKPFATVQELKDQLERDVEFARTAASQDPDRFLPSAIP
jgi:riboflavin kinase / FMN adenylyltransferase